MSRSLPYGFTSRRYITVPAVSVAPYCTENTGPMRSTARRSSGTGTGAAAATTLRRLDRSQRSQPGASSRACSIADTTKVKRDAFALDRAQHLHRIEAAVQHDASPACQ